MEWKIAVVDDSQPDRERLASDLRARFKEGEHLRLSCFESGGALLADYRPGAYELVFLDIIMDGVNGVELAGRLRELDERLLMVFLTTSREYAFDVLPFHPFDYLVKPYAPEALDRVLREARRLREAKEPELSVRAGRSDYSVPYSRILAVVSRGHTVEIKTASGETLLASATFGALRQILEADPRFLLCNRGILLNMDCITASNGAVFRMTDGQEYPLRVRGCKELMARFSQYKISHMRGRMGL